MELIQNVNNPEIYVLYGSQTGQAEAIANEIHEAGVFKTFNIKIFCLKEENKKFNIADVKCAIFVCSTTGDGDPPENARKFIRSISRKTVSQDFLAHLHYALLGLGDTNYSTFCGGPKRLEKELKAHGATSFYPTAFADDAVGLEEVVEPWIDGLFPALQSHINVLSNFSPNLKETELDCNEMLNGCEKSLPVGVDIVENFTKLNIDCESKSINLLESETVKVSQGTESCEVSLNLIGNVRESSPIVKSTKPSFMDLTLPPIVPCYLDLKLDDSKVVNASFMSYQNDAAFAVASSDIFKATILSAKQISQDNAIKRAIEIKLGVKEVIDFYPGDSFAICCRNDESEVNWLINRLHLEKIADACGTLIIRSDTSKKKQSVPPHIPQPFTIRHALSSCLEIRSVPKKPLLRALVDYTSDSAEKRRLQELCSRQGSDEYTELIRGPNISILDLLATFPSCKPPFELLAQHLPRLQPRRYSIANSPLKDSQQLTFVFNVVRFNVDHGRAFYRNGVCTGFLERFLSRSIDGKTDFEAMNESSLKIFLTKSTGFRLPTDMSQPIVMIGPGSGVAPFIGFLEHRAAIGGELGESWLFYGCRHKLRDFLYEEKLKTFEKDGTLSHLTVAFSRDPPTTPSNSPRYVQDNLRLHKAAVVDLLLRKNAIFYVCGDAKNMAKDVRQCLVELIASEIDCSQSEANDKLKQVITEKRYREDIWT